MAELPTLEEFAKQVAEKALDEIEYKGRTIRQWADLIVSGDVVERKSVVTNADRIRAMSDEELASWISDILWDSAESIGMLGEVEISKWLDWLKQEAGS